MALNLEEDNVGVVIFVTIVIFLRVTLSSVRVPLSMYQLVRNFLGVLLMVLDRPLMEVPVLRTVPDLVLRLRHLELFPENLCRSLC